MDSNKIVDLIHKIKNKELNEEEINEIVENIKCPITHAIFKNPVRANDNITYERTSILEWLKNKNTSPCTRAEIFDLTDNVDMKELIDIFLLKYPDYLKEQYDYKDSFLDFKDECKKYVKNKNFDKLLYYVEFDLSDDNFTYNLFKDCKDKNVLKHVIDNTIDLECINNEGWRPIHYLCRYSTPEMIRYIIDKGVNLECINKYKMRPIHFICALSTPEMIKYIIDKGVDIECDTNEGWRPIHFICRYSTPEMISYIIEKEVNLECENNEGWRPIHFICALSTPEMIRYIIEKGVNLECETNEGWRPIHIIWKFSTLEMIKYILNKKTGLNYENNADLIKYIINEGIIMKFYKI
jgi:ankyrin repeat protein